MLYTTGNPVTDKMKALFVVGTHFFRKPYTEYQLQNSLQLASRRDFEVAREMR